MKQSDNQSPQNTEGANPPSLREGSGGGLYINVGRQIGSGGCEVARRLADIFRAEFYDRELLQLAAKESGFVPEFFEKSDEQRGFLRSLLNLQALHVNDQGGTTNNFSQEALFKYQSDAIRRAAEEHERCVFVGRCADYVLRDLPQCVNVFVTAPLDFRIAQVAARQGCTDDAARRLIERGEQARASYYNYYTGKHWGAAEGYHLCVDASLLGIDRTADFIADFIRARS